MNPQLDQLEEWHYLMFISMLTLTLDLWKDLTKIGFGILATALWQYTPMPGHPLEHGQLLVGQGAMSQLMIQMTQEMNRRAAGGGMVIHHNQALKWRTGKQSGNFK